MVWGLWGTPGRRGFGSRILGATIRGQLGGLLEEQWPPSGIPCDLALPLARAVAETPEFALAR